ncbi:6-phosphogluconate dehydrogenase [Cucumis melo var. makuwa]|uniref:phosphogluconate dehydrogenase (NADP(+)-dependent, decarboxylating) n=1 Tax=Cucumis melo var. makuwa TaxID=1194695 RepID=A0A5A7V1S9_CUCMM|nr:6-phosphogluconate dehydrogenase [Cucumis melo var. makuwa]TYK24784.1 6-phosphogluconate dehydrogenase [Cucumis melo var. makuwa]
MRRVVGLAIPAGISTPGMCASLACFDTYRCARLSANLVQAQSDLFGAYTYERVDRQGSYHTEWTKLARNADAGVGILNRAFDLPTNLGTNYEVVHVVNVVKARSSCTRLWQGGNTVGPGVGAITKQMTAIEEMVVSEYNQLDPHLCDKILEMVICEAF